MWPVAECLPSMCSALGSLPSMAKREKKENLPYLWLVFTGVDKGETRNHISCHEIQLVPLSIDLES